MSTRTLIMVLTAALISFATPAMAYMECTVNGDCYFLYIPKKVADGYSRDSTLSLASPTDDIDVCWYYEDGSTCTDILEANQTEVCAPAANQACMSHLGNGVYKIGVDASLISQAGKKFCVDVKDVQPTRTVADEVLCNHIYSQSRVTSTTGLTVGTVNDKTGYALSAAGVDAIWDEAQSGHATAGTFGKYLDAQVSLISGGGGSPDWTATEKENIRYRLGVDGTATAPATNTPNLGDVGITQAGADKVWSTTARTITGGTITTNNDKAGYALSTAGVDAILDDTVEGSLTMRQMVKIMAAALAGKAAGGGTTTITFTGLDGVTARITATVDANGNRSAVTVNGN